MCKFCDITNATDVNPFSGEEMQGFVDDVWKGLNTPNNLSRLMYNKTADKLSEGLRLGLSISASGVPEADPKFRLAKDLQQNIFRFSGAKTYQQTVELNNLLIGSDGVTRTFGQFQKEAKKVLNKFNGHHLAAEYQRAVAGSQQAQLWDKIQETKEFLPLLQYQTAGDDRVRPTHKALDNIVRPVDDPFWLNYYPPNGWYCRCTVISIEEGDEPETDLSGFVKPNDVPDEFLINTGQQRLIYNDKHPYYEVMPRDINLASMNFNLPIPATPTAKLVGPLKGKVNINKLIPLELKEWGIEATTNKKVFEFLKTPVKFTKTNVEGDFFHSPRKSEVVLNVGGKRWGASKYFQKQVVNHEVGHAVHTQLNIIDTVKKNISPEYKKHFSKLKKLIKGKEAQINTDLWKIYRSSFSKSDAALLVEFKTGNYRDVQEMAGNAMDALQALTNSRYGAGHPVSYMNKAAKKEAEMFAHSMENFLDGNPVFKKIMPEVYEESIKFVGSIKK